MFSGFDFKRFSLDALQDEEEAAEGNAEVVVPPQPQPAAPEAPPPKLPQRNEEQSEWDWDQDDAAENKPVSNAITPPQRHAEETHPEQPGESLTSTSADPGPGMSLGKTAPARSEKESSSLTVEGETRGLEREVAADNPLAVAEVFQEAGQGLPANAPVTELEERAPQLVRSSCDLPLFLSEDPYRTILWMWNNRLDEDETAANRYLL